MDKKIKYDVAISFLAEDELIARQIADELSKNFKVFFFPKNQEQIAGTDGVESFSSVFLKESRLNVVLYREKWGKTKWTQIEETAIKSRIFEDSWNSLVFVKLEKTENPNWIPATYIYLNYEFYGMNNLIPIIQHRIEQQGGIGKIETLKEAAIRIKREMDLENELLGYMNSEKAIIDAKNEVIKLLDNLEENYNELFKLQTGLAVGQLKKEYLHYSFPIEGTSLNFIWIQKYSNVVHGSRLKISLHDLSTGNQKESKYYDFGVNKLKEIGWKSEEEFFKSEGLVEYWMRELLELGINRKRKLY